jgi:hypothetical protein
MRPLAFDEIAFPCRGVWVSHRGRERVVAEPGVCFFPRGLAYRASHPHGCGDVNTGVVLHTGTLREIVREHDPAAADRSQGPLRATRAPLDAGTVLLHHCLLRVACIACGSEARSYLDLMWQYDRTGWDEYTAARTRVEERGWLDALEGPETDDPVE